MKPIKMNPGVFKGSGSKIMRNQSPPKLGGGFGMPAPKNIANALGIQVGANVHPQMMLKLFGHPDLGVSSTAKMMYGKMNQTVIKKSKHPY